MTPLNVTSYPQFVPALCAAVFLALAAAIAWWQSAQGPTCPRHHRHADWAAWSLVALCVAAGVALVLAVIGGA